MKKLFLSILLAFIGLASMMADEPFRKHRYDSWKVMALPENAIVFVGNSITDMHNWTEAFGNDARVVNRGNSGGFSYEVLDNVQTWVRFKPAKVFIKIGTNDLGTNCHEDAIALNIQRTVDIIRRESPATEIYLQSILPAYNQSYKTPATIAATNVLIKAIADKDAKVTYIDLNSKLTGITSGQPYSLDNLHLMAYGYKVWTDAIKDYVGIDPVYPANTQTIQSAAGLSGSNGMRATYFSVQPVKSTDVLFFGDEMVKNGEWQELLHNQNVKNRGTGWGYGGDIVTVSKLVDASFANADNGVTRQQPAKILLYTGTGDINGINNSDKTLQTAETAYAELIAKLKEKAPTTPIALVSLMPTQNANSNITAFNTWLQSQAEADDQLTYVDIYSVLAQASGAANTAYFSGNYIYGMGYIQVARKLAEFIGGCTVISDAEAQQLKAVADARITLQKNIFVVEDAPEGNGIGQYTTASKATAKDCATTASALLASLSTNVTELQTAATNIQTAVDAMKSSIIKPTEASTAGKFFTLNTPNRDQRYLTGNGAGQTMTGRAWSGNDSQVWQLVWRSSDSSFDVVNVYDGSYMTTTSPITTSTTAPAKGWTFGESNSLGLFTIVSGTNQLNQQNTGDYTILNWGSGTTKGDDGCNYAIEEIAEGDFEHYVPLVVSGKTYTIQGYVKSAGTKLYITYNNGARALEADATGDATQQWVAHASGQKFYFESVQSPGTYLKFAAHADGVSTDATSANVLFSVAKGIEDGTVSLQGTPSGQSALRYMASSSDGSKLGDYYASSQTKAGNNSGILWSTDFILTEVSSDVEAVKVSSLDDLTDGYYIIRNLNTADQSRRGYVYHSIDGKLSVNTADKEKAAAEILTEGAYSSDYIWKVTKNGSTWTIATGNGTNQYWPSMTGNAAMSASATAGAYTITEHADGNGTFQLKVNNVYVNANPGQLATWSNAHALEFYKINGVSELTTTLTYVNTRTKAETTVDVKLPSVKGASDVTRKAHCPASTYVASYDGNTVNYTPYLLSGNTYTIKATFADGKAYYLIDNGTNAAASETLPEDGSGEWLVTADNKLQNVKTPTRYLAANSGQSGLSVNTTGEVFTIGEGLAAGNYAIYNAAYSFAVKYDGTVAGGRYSDKRRNNAAGANNWTTDFVFVVTVPADDLLPFTPSASVEDPKWNNMTLVNTSKTAEVFDLYSDGSKLKETKNATAEQKAADKYMWAFIKSGNGYLVYSKLGHYLKAATKADEEVTVTTDASQAALFTLSSKKVNNADCTVLTTTFDGSTATYLSHYSASALTVHYYNGGGGLSYAANVATFVKPAAEEEPEEQTYNVDKTGGAMTGNGTWNNQWTSADGRLTLTSNANNMQWSSNDIDARSGSAQSATYTLAVASGYEIVSYSFKAKALSNDQVLSVDGNTFNLTSAGATTISDDNVGATSVVFNLTGENTGTLLSEFNVVVRPREPQTDPGITFSTDAEQHWYYVYSTATNDYARGKVWYYNAESDRMMFGDKAFMADRIWSFWKNADGKIAIKSYDGIYVGTAGAGTGGSTQFGKSDAANFIYQIDNIADAQFTISDGSTPLHAQQAGSVLVRWQAEPGNASTWNFQEVNVDNAQAAVAYTRVQQGRVTTGIGNKNLPILRSTINVSGLTGDVSIEGLSGTIVNKANVSAVKAYLASNARELVVEEDALSWREANGELLGNGSIAADGSFTINFDQAVQAAPGAHYIWLALDIDEAAEEGSTVDATITSYKVGGANVAEQNGNPAYEATIFLSEGTVLMPKDKGVDKVNGSTYFRIPAITSVLKNGQPRLVTLTDDRKEHNSDLPSHCYVVAQYSDDLGKTWSEPQCVAGTSETGGDYGHGDASIVTNRDNGEITGIMVSSGSYGHGYFAGTNTEPARWRTITSKDGGETWSAPHDFTDDLYAAQSPNEATRNWLSGFSGSGAALQKRDGTLVSSFVNRESPDGSSTGVTQNFYFIMSKDGGKHWYVSGTSGTTAADEPKTLERNNGDLAISVRAGGYNFHNVTSDNGKTWKNAPQTRFTSGINGNACDGEYMVWCSTVDGNERNIAFQTLPNSGNRQNVSIALSTDEGETFGAPKTICPSGSAYSAATVLPDGTLGVYYEENGIFGGYTMRFVRFSLNWASNGAYNFNKVPFKPISSTRADVNGDGYVNADDAAKVALDAKNDVQLQHSYSESTRVSDVNYDGVINVNDAVEVVDTWTTK